ncbi:MAG: glycosyltransferase [Candidatus Omnitrophica bacterium]|nr:glycosyltransferase [Candidatus Omnitrophota bacterium]
MSAKKRVLLLYISVNSGHQRAALAIEKALRLLAPEAEILAVNSFNYTNPLVEKVINRTYLGVIKNKPEVWEYLYDNPKVFRSLGRLRDSIHKFNSGKLKILLDEFKPDVIACTQAFPCGMIADYKTSFGLKVPLIGVLTDCYPHSYWFFDSVDHYIVNSEAATKRLIEHGIPREKIKDYGIPIDPKFTENVDDEVVRKKLGLDPGLPTVLIMGGNQGLGPLAELVNELNRISCPLQLIIVAGSNKRLFDWLERKKRLLRFKMVVYGFTSEVTELMSVSTLIVTKPGGLTISEALSKELPIIILNPIPGQEAKNTEYLTSEGAAVKADSAADAALLTEMLLVNKSKLEHMRGNARRIAKPRSSTDIARLILECANS